jgi:hypothetical protein
MSERKVVNGTSYDPGTPDEVIRVLEGARGSRVRLAIAYRAESVPEFGRVGRTTGDVKSPILVHNARSLGGFLIPTAIIVEIRESEGGKVLYREGA